MSPGLLIVFEGSEGAGKTTQVRMLGERLREEGVDMLSLREPGGTPLGDAIRSILLDPAQNISAPSEALLFMASRAEIVREQIDPALARGVVVLMDRFFLSTYAYQIFGRGLPESGIRSANALAAGGRVPDLNIVLEIPATEGMERATARGAHDRIEQSGDAFHNRVEGAFASFTGRDWQSKHPECGPIAGVDGRGTPDEVHARVLDALARNLPVQFAMLSKESRS
ncbi:MAG: dTMP kinase [Gemmatimonadales bacterium]